MGGGLMQLVAYGAQDIYLTGNPQITFFKVVYRRHTNFSMEAIRQTFSGTAAFGSDVTATISRNGDLVHRMYLEVDAIFNGTGTSAGDDVGLVEHYGHSIIKECEIEIGGQKIDKHTSMWNRVWSDLTEFNPTGFFGFRPTTMSQAVPISTDVPVDNSTGTLYQLMTGNSLGWNTEASSNAMNDFSSGSSGATLNGFTYTEGGDSGAATSTEASITTKVFLPLNFWFNRNPGLALPLIALQYHEVKVKMNFETPENLIRATGTASFEGPTAGSAANVHSSSFNLWCDYIYLDTDERRRFAQVSHEYLIEQLQYSENTLGSSPNDTIDLNFNHPVKELIWTMRNETSGDTGGRNQAMSADHGDHTASPVSLDNIGGNWQLKLNGHDRFQERDTTYFTKTQVWQHHTGYGGVPTFGRNDYEVDSSNEAAVRVGDNSIAVYSFALKPEEHQPSGTCNFSRIDNAQLVGTNLTTFACTTADTASSGIALNTADQTTNIKLTIFAVNYNVLRIMSGMGGLAYSN